MDTIANIFVLDGQNAAETIDALELRKQHPDSHAVNAHANSRERIGKSPGQRYRYDALKHTGGKHFDGIDDPSPEDDVPQFTPEEEFEGPDDSPTRAIMKHPALRTVDNMQIYRASQRFMYDEKAFEADKDNEDPNHLEYWMHRPDEKLDAVIIPSNVGPLAYNKIANGLERLKKAQPEVKIIQISSFNAPQKPLIDVQLTSPTARALGDAVRDAISVPRLPEPTVEDRTNRNLEAWRLDLLNRGNSPASLPRHLKRPGDPGYEPSKNDKDGRGGRG